MAEETDSVNVISPSGKMGSFPKAKAEDVIANYGYKPASSEDVKTYFAKEKYGGALGAAESFGLGALGGATIVGPGALAKSGLVSQETQEDIERAHPVAHGVGTVAGIGAGLLTAGESEAVGGAAEALMLAKESGDAAKIAEATSSLAKAKNIYTASDLVNPVSAIAKTGGKVAEGVSPMVSRLTALAVNPETSPIASRIANMAIKTGAGSAVEGALFSTGDLVNESLLGDTDLSAEHILHNVGYGTLLGGGIGVLAGGLHGAYSGYKAGKLKGAIDDQASRDVISENANNMPPPPPSGELQEGVLSSSQEGSISPSSMKEMETRLAQNKFMGIEPGLPQRKVLEEAEQNVGKLEYPILPEQRRSLESKIARDKFSASKEMDTKPAQLTNEWEAAQKNEHVSRVNGQVDSLAPGKKLTSDAVEGGDKAANGFMKAHDAEKEALKPQFKEFDKLSTTNAIPPGQIIAHLEENLPGISQYIEQDEKGLWKLKERKASLNVGEAETAAHGPITKETHGELKDLVKELNDPKLTLGGIRNIREGMGTGYNTLTNPKATYQTGKVRKALMDVYQSGIQAANPSLEVREAFKRYAINAEAKTQFERLIGGKIGDRADLLKRFKSEKVLDKIFSDANHVKLAKQLLSPEDFKEALGNHLKHEMEELTDRTANGFKSKRFSNFLKKNKPALDEAFRDNPDVLKRIEAHTNIMTILPDAPSANPSGSAKTWFHMAKEAAPYLLRPDKAVEEAGHGIVNKFTEIRQNHLFNQQLSAQAEQKATQAETLANVERNNNKTNNQISNKSKSLFDFLKTKRIEPIPGFIGEKLTPDDTKDRLDKHEKVANQLNKFISDPESLVNNLQKSTAAIFDHAPQTFGSLHQAAARATQFLASKLPQVNASKPLSSKPVISEAELSKFQRYQNTVTNPLGALDSLKSATIVPETMETLSQVYPKLLNKMQMDVTDKMSSFIAKNGPDEIPYKIKMSLSMFLGQDLVDSLSQPNILANQISLQGNGQQQAQGQMQQHVKTSQTGLSKLNKAEGYMTAMQDSANRGSET